MTLIPTIELSPYCPGMVTALGVSVGLTRPLSTPRAPGHRNERWAPDLLSSDQDRGLGHHRTRVGIGRVRLHDLHGPPGRRRIPAQRIEDVHHQRSLRRHHRVHLQAGRGQPAGGTQGAQLRPRHGHAGARTVQAAAEDGDALVADRPALPDRRAGRKRPPDRRDRGGPAGGREGAKATFAQERIGRGRHGARASSNSASSCRSTTPRNGCSSASPSASSSSSRTSWPAWRWPG